MIWLEEYWLRLVFVVIYLALLVHHCLGGKPSKSLSKDDEQDCGKSTIGNFLTGGGTLGGCVIALSFYATFVSTNTFIGHAGKSWDVGLIWYVKLAVYALTVYLAWYLVAPRFVARAQQYDSLTVADFLGHRYQSLAVRRVSAIVILVGSVLYLIAVYKASSFALEAFLGLEYEVAAVTIFLVVTTYTLVGGFRAVVRTDAVQGLLMVVGAVALIVAVIYQGGGLVTILEKVHAQNPKLVSWQGNIPLMSILGLALAGGLKLLVDPRQISRFYGLKDHPDKRALRVAQVVAPLLILITYVCMLPIGTLAHALIPIGEISDSDRVMPYLLGNTQVLGPTLSSLFLLVLLSAAMSSLDSVLLVAASSVGRDFFLISDDDSRSVAVMRLWVTGISLASMLLALNPFAGIVEITALSGSLYAACFLPTLVVGMYWKQGTAHGALACILVGSVTVIGWYCAKGAGWTNSHEVYIGVGVAVAAYVGVSMLTSPAGRDDVSNG